MVAHMLRQMNLPLSKPRINEHRNKPLGLLFLHEGSPQLGNVGRPDMQAMYGLLPTPAHA